MGEMDATQNRTEKGDERGLRLSLRSSLIPLLGLVAGGGLGKALAGVPGFTDPVQRALGPVLGPFLTASDNLILFLGLFILLICACALACLGRKGAADEWARKRA